MIGHLRQGDATPPGRQRSRATSRLMPPVESRHCWVCGSCTTLKTPCGEVRFVRACCSIICTAACATSWHARGEANSCVWSMGPPGNQVTTTNSVLSMGNGVWRVTVRVRVLILILIPLQVQVQVQVKVLAWQRSQKPHAAPCPARTGLGQAPRSQIEFSLVG